MNPPPGRTAEVGDFCWDALVARVLHPVQVGIIEALRWIDQPLTATDLLHVFDAKRSGLRIEHHLRRLTGLDAVVLGGNGEAPGPMGNRPYCLVRQSKT